MPASLSRPPRSADAPLPRLSCLPRLSLLGTSLLLAACQATAPTLGGGQGGTVATGSAGGANATGSNPQLETCTETLGTVGVDEDTRAPWYYDLQSRRLGPTTPVLRMMIQQSNCFVVVERGASMNNVMRERSLERSGETRPGSNFAPGQLVSADYTISPSVQFAAKGTQGMNLGGFGAIGSALGAVAGSVKANEAATTLLMVDNRSGVQLAAAQGSAKNWDVGGVVGLFGSGLGAAGGGYSNTPEGRIVVAALMDSYNQLVKAARNYKAQQVRGGLGTGGTLGVQGGSTPASQALQPAAAPAPVPAPAAAPAAAPRPSSTSRPPAKTTPAPKKQ
ncbi:MAG: peptidoglycan-binding protein [Burkholderiales bacterium]|nr:MAG: peptidoglycan-binding protein [Burkholderiales bacterium]